MANIPRARKAFEDFSGHKPQKIRKSRLDDRNVAGWQMGPVVGIAYEAKRDGETARYFHEFKKSARPNLVARDDGRQLYIDGGRYKVTDRGIEDMPALFVVNPSPRKGAAKKKAKPMARRRRRSAARRRSPVVIVRSNPVRRRRRRSILRSVARAPARRRRARSYRRNPIARRRRSAGLSIPFGKWVIPAAGIGLGAVGAEIIVGYLPIPAQFKVGPMRHVAKGAVAVLAGMAIGKLARQKKLGNAIALGGVAVATYDFAKEFLAARLPGVPLGMYMHTGGGSLGYYNPAAVLPGPMGMYVDTAPGGFAGASSDGSGVDFRA